jgi:cyclophilin family peptidyl-prolyl cis-trans isomerase
MENLGMNGRPFTSGQEGTRSNWRAAVVLSLAAVVAGCGEAEPTGTSPPTGQERVAPDPPSKEIDHAHPVVRIETNLGTIGIRLDAVRAPGTVRNFLNYANSGFYDNTIVHYVDPGELIVAGGYNTDRTPKPPRQAIRNEAHNDLKNLRGTIAMARDSSLIDSATSQFFINLADAPQRDYQGDTADKYGYCVFGEVTDGFDVAQRISESPTTNLGGDLLQTPKPPVVVKAIRVIW